MTAHPLAIQIQQLLERSRIGINTELEAQADIAAILQRAGLDVRAEVRLTQADRIDLLVGAVGIEVKIGGQKRRVYDQLSRYAVCPDIEALVLASSVSWRGGLGPIHGKPVFIASLSRGHL
jgi:hypothetical protein